jgi:ADP-heptose:LPS heptosyltransferase
MFLNKRQVINKSYNLVEKFLKLKVKVKSTEEIIEETKLIPQEKVDQYFEKNKTLIKLPVDISNNLIKKEHDKKYIALSTGTSPRWLSKKWGVENYSKLIKKLMLKYGIVLIGSDLELEDEKYIVSQLGKDNIHSYVDKTNLTQLKNLLYQVDLYIGNDSGPSHIAAGVGTNTVTIFGSTDVKHCVRNIPYTAEHICIKPTDDIKCYPCYKTKCPTNMECMKSITVDFVYNEVIKLLEIGETK